MSLLKTKHDPYIKNIFKPVKPDEKTEKMELYCYKGVNSVLYKLISCVLNNMQKSDGKSHENSDTYNNLLNLRYAVANEYQKDIFQQVELLSKIGNDICKKKLTSGAGKFEGKISLIASLRKFDKDAKKWAVSLKDWANAEKERRIEKNSKEAEEMASKKALEFNPLAVKPEISAPKLINKWKSVSKKILAVKK